MPSPAAALSAVTRLIRRFSRNRRAASAVEFALVAPMFLALVFAILETALYFFAGQLLEIGTQDTARLMYTNQAQGTMSATQFQNNLCARVAALMNCTGVYVDVKSFSSFTAIQPSDLADPIDANGNFVNNFTYQPGGPGDIVVVRLFYQWPVYVSLMGFNLSNVNGGKRLLVATAAFRNEPYSN
jgi:Flp pilus assembly protein TadG